METTKTSKTSILPTLLGLYDAHTKYFHNALADISEQDAQNRLNTKANHISWIAGSLVHQAYSLANAVGIDKKQAADELFANWQGIQDGVTYPSLASYKKDWDAIRGDLRNALANMSDEELEGPDPFNLPDGKYTFFELLTFCIDRESYCIGQIALYRRLLGYDAMKYE
jgi:hypothetical protein